MPAYAYPITIKRTPQTITMDETIPLKSEILTIELLQPLVGGDPFTFNVTENERGGPRYELTVTRTRIETAKELATRVAREEAYMDEYHRRQAVRKERIVANERRRSDG